MSALIAASAHRSDMDQPRVDLAACFAAHADWLRGVACRLTGSRQAAEDLVQETFQYAVEHQAELYGGPALRSWLLRVTRHKALHGFRGNARYRRATERLGHEPLPAPPDPSEPVLRREEAARVRRCLARVTAERAAVLALFELDGLVTVEIADRLGIAPGTVGSRLTRGRAEFRAAWRHVEAEERRPTAR